MLWSAASVSGCRELVVGCWRSGCGTGQLRRPEAPGRERMVSRLKLVQDRIWRMSHQKCLVLGSRRGNEIVRTREGAGFAVERKFMRVVDGVGSGVGVDERLSGEGARGTNPQKNCSFWG